MKMPLIELILQILTLVIVILTAFTKSYAMEKAKNLATKEDVEEITIKVEGIKTEFVRETELIKQQIQLSNQIKLNIKIDEQKALLDYYTKYHQLLSLMLDFSYTRTSSNVMKPFYEKENAINDAYFNLKTAEEMIKLFIQSDELNRIIKTTSKQCLEMKQIVIQSIYEFEILLSTFEIESLELDNSDSQMLDSLRNAQLKTKVKFIEDFYKKRLSIFKEMVPAISEFRVLVRALISELTKHA